MLTGVLARATLIKSIYRRGVNLTGSARTKITNADLVNHISTDVSCLRKYSLSQTSSRVHQVSRIDACAQWFVSEYRNSCRICVHLCSLISLHPFSMLVRRPFAKLLPTMLFVHRTYLQSGPLQYRSQFASSYYSSRYVC